MEPNQDKQEARGERKRGCVRESNNSKHRRRNNNSGNNDVKQTSSSAKKKKIQVGNAGTFLLCLLEKNENDIRAGPIDRSNVDSYDNLQIVSEFLKQHALAVAADSTKIAASQKSATSNNNNAVPVTAASFYLPAVNEFKATQLDRQVAGLRTNTAKETTEGLTQVVNGHASALKLAMAHSTTNKSFLGNNGSENNHSFGLSKDVLCSFHSMLCPSHAKSGRFRTTQAKAGNAYFCPAGNIDSEMDKLFTFMEIIWSKWLKRKNGHGNNCSSLDNTYYAVSLAAVLMYAINDIHPFADGNGRMSRICVNFVLQRLLGLPFTITLVATQVQRQEYIDGLKEGHSTYQRLSANSSATTTPEKYSIVSVFTPLISMILDRMAHAIRQLQQLLVEKARAATAEEEARVARLARERAAAGQCVICLDEKPNIATLCCGQAVHLNCIAEWLANQTTCVSCRAPLPQLLRPQAPARPDVNAINDTTQSEELNEWSAVLFTEETTTSETSETENNPTSPLEDASTATTEEIADNTDTTTEEAADYTGTTTTEETPSHPAILHCQRCNNQAATDCGNQMCGRCCLGSGSFCPRHAPAPPPDMSNYHDEDTTTPLQEDSATGEDDTENTSSTTTMTTTSNIVSSRTNNCNICNNQAAGDCDNGMCGRCCVLRGTFHCFRHNG